MANFVEVCRQAGVKVTHPRMEIFREVAQTEKHPDAETVLQEVRERVATMSLDTVYRILWLLSDLALVHTLDPLRERTRFDTNLKGHHHFVCVECGLSPDFESEGLANLPTPASARKSGRVEAIQLEARGICRECGSKRKPRRTSQEKQERP